MFLNVEEETGAKFLHEVRVCVCYCSTYYKTVRVGGGGTMEDMCYERLRVEACVD
jgi:hypothetical protein